MKKHWILRNVTGAAAFVIALMVAASFILKSITRHNVEIDVPDFTALSVSEAEKIARSCELRLDVTDSVYNERIGRGCIFSQNPKAGSHVKKNRRILLTINSMVPKMVPMPDLVGLSLRQAKTEIYSKGLTIGRLIYEPDIATNNVLRQQYRGEDISSGRKLEAGSRVDLVLGCDDESSAFIPQLKGFSLDVAKDFIWENSLNVGKIYYDETVQNYLDTVNAVVYRQEPGISENGCPMGTTVDIHLTTSSVK